MIANEVGVLSTDPEKPVYLFAAGNDPAPLLFNNYNNSAPPKSKFAVPPACAKVPLVKRSPHHGGSYLPQFGVHVPV